MREPVLVAVAAAAAGGAEGPQAVEHGVEAAGGHGAQALFHVGPLAVTSPIVTEWAVIALLVILGAFAARRLAMKPRGVGNVAEVLTLYIVDGIGAQYLGSREKAYRYLPLLGSLFLFIIVSNYSGLLPGAGRVPGFQPPTGVLSVTAALALIAFVSTQIAGLREQGLHYLGHFLKPYPFMLPLNLLEEVIRPVSLALRLFGNIFGEETILAVLLGLAAYFVPIPIMGLSLLFGFLQAFIFTTLTAVYIGGAVGEGH